MNVPMRYTINAPSKKNNRCRSSAKRVISPKADRDAAVAGLVATESLSFGGSFQASANCLLSSRDVLDLAASGFDRRLGALGQVHTLDRHRAADAAGRNDTSAIGLRRDHVRGL